MSRVRSQDTTPRSSLGRPCAGQVFARFAHAMQACRVSPMSFFPARGLQSLSTAIFGMATSTEQGDLNPLMPSCSAFEMRITGLRRFPRISGATSAIRLRSSIPDGRS